jgi:hypothetical protein
MSEYWGTENLWSAFLEKRMRAPSGNTQGRRETEVPSVSWARHARRTLIANGNCETGAIGAGCLR